MKKKENKMANQITITWAASPSPISGYNVYRDGSNFALNNSPITEPTYTDNSVFPGNTYSYDVTAVLNGIESADSLTIVSPPVPFGYTPLTLDFGVASSFGLLAASTITNVPGTDTIVAGNIGIYPGTSITGFEAPVQVEGDIHLADYAAGYAQSAVTATFVAGMGLTAGATMSGDIGGQRLTPGVYSRSSSLAITGVLVLDAQANPEAVWIFQIGSTLTTANENSNIVIVGGGQACNVFWLVGSSATLGSDTTFIGNIIAYASITVGIGASVQGRLAARSGAISLNGNEIITFAPSLSKQTTIYSLTQPLNVPPAPPAAPTGLVITSES
jgi:hypothetical protein